MVVELHQTLSGGGVDRGTSQTAIVEIDQGKRRSDLAGCRV
ncbi:hypothetical protein [Williamsia sp. DF01-3]